MKNQTQVILREIRKNTYMEIEAVDALMMRVKDVRLAEELFRQSKIYAVYYEKACRQLMQAEKRLYKDINGKNRTLRIQIWLKVFSNGSAAHMARLMMQHSEKGIMDMYRILNHNKYADTSVYEFACELLRQQEQDIIRLREYL